MIEVFRKGHTVDLVLPGDNVSPTVFACEVMTDEEESTFHLFRSYAVSMVESLGPNDLQAAAEKVRVNVKQNRHLLATKIKMVTNAPPDGGTITDTEAIEKLLTGMMPEQLAILRGALSDQNKLNALKFRGNPVPRTPAGTGRSGEAAQESAGDVS